MSDVLPDVFEDGLIIVFCGTAVSAKSADVGAYYGNPTNAFWRTLYEIGLTPYQLQPSEFRKVAQYSIGLTDVAKSASGNDSDLSKADFDRVALTQKIEQYQPAILAFTSKRAYREGVGLTNQAVEHGWQSETIHQTQIYVLPSPSGAARGYWDISIWQELADRYQQLRTQHDNLD